MFSVHNSLSGRTEPFKPLREGEVKVYHCGPTVYDFVHIGNLRAFVFADILRRSFEYLGWKVTQVMNITDLGHLVGDGDSGEDKMTKALKREGKPLTLASMRELAEYYTERFKEDTLRLNILPPHHLPKASEHIKEDIELVNELEDKGFTYKTSDGIYFDTGKDPHYGRLHGTGEGESRIGENTEKKNSKDFALWKFNTEIGYPSPWGQGFPGWHIECSAMSQKYLGKTFDIHTGGIDLAPIHHNNEIAQSENACGCEYARYFLHNEFVNLDSSKMAKSTGNILKLHDIEEKGNSALAYRYFLLLSHYRKPTNFSWEALEAAQNAYRKLKNFVSELNFNEQSLVERSDPRTLREKFTSSIQDDFNTPEALATVWNLVKDESISPADKRATLLDFDKVLGLSLDQNEFELKEVPAEIQKLVDEREKARMNKDFHKSDNIRKTLEKMGYLVEDSPSGPKISKK